MPYHIKSAYQIRSTYEPWSPDYDDNLAGRRWPGEFVDQPAAWSAVEQYLLTEQQWQRIGDGLAPFGHTEPTAFPTDTVIQNDAETIYIEPA